MTKNSKLYMWAGSYSTYEGNEHLKNGKWVTTKITVVAESKGWAQNEVRLAASAAGKVRGYRTAHLLHA
jgi:hypothetical protein